MCLWRLVRMQFSDRRQLRLGGLRDSQHFFSKFQPASKRGRPTEQPRLKSTDRVATSGARLVRRLQRGEKETTARGSTAAQLIIDGLHLPDAKRQHSELPCSWLANISDVSKHPRAASLFQSCHCRPGQDRQGPPTRTSLIK